MDLRNARRSIMIYIVVTCSTYSKQLRNFCQTVYAGKYRGIIDDIGIFNVVLSEDEIQSIMDDGLEKAFAVSLTDKLTTTWAAIKK